MRYLTRYSIRSLLVFVTLACVVMGWYVSNRREHEREMAVLDRLHQGWRMGFWRGEEGENPPGWGFALNTAHLVRPGPPWVRDYFSKFDRGVTLRVAELRILRGEVGDNDIPELAKLKSLRRLRVQQSLISPQGEQQLRALLPETMIVLTRYRPQREGTFWFQQIREMSPSPSYWDIPGAGWEPDSQYRHSTQSL